MSELGSRWRGDALIHSPHTVVDVGLDCDVSRHALQRIVFALGGSSTDRPTNLPHRDTRQLICFSVHSDCRCSHNDANGDGWWRFVRDRRERFPCPTQIALRLFGLGPIGCGGFGCDGA